MEKHEIPMETSSTEEEEGEFVSTDAVLDLFIGLTESWLDKNGHDAFADALLKKKMTQLNQSSNVKKRKHQ